LEEQEDDGQTEYGMGLAQTKTTFRSSTCLRRFGDGPVCRRFENLSSSFTALLLGSMNIGVRSLFNHFALKTEAGMFFEVSENQPTTIRCHHPRTETW
jgi:hypothetical protein